jgi:nickel transport protein
MSRLVLLFVSSILASLLLLTATTAYAHGVTVEQRIEQTMLVTLTASYETGEPMAGAQVTIYAPDEPTTPWQTGTCDEAGRYQFAPDPALAGTWEVQVRQAGHGKTIYVNVGAPASAAAALQAGSDLPYTPLQAVLMGGAVVWGCVGTAFFFAARRH